MLHHDDDLPQLTPTLSAATLAEQKLCDEMPPWVTALVERNYEADGTANYIFTGRPEYVFQGNGLNISSENLIGWLIETIPNPKILDVGTGNGAFIEAVSHSYKTIQAYGLSATDLRYHKKPSPYYHVGDIERLSATAPLLATIKFHLIVSGMTFRHLCNLKSALIESYNALEPDGLLIIDNFKFPGLTHTEHKLLIAFLHSQGHKIAALYQQPLHDNGYQVFILQKTPLPLEIPLIYKEAQKHSILFHPNKNFLAYIKHHEETQKKSKMPTLNDFEEIFCDPTFERMSWQKRCELLKNLHTDFSSVMLESIRACPQSFSLTMALEKDKIISVVDTDDFQKLSLSEQLIDLQTAAWLEGLADREEITFRNVLSEIGFNRPIETSTKNREEEYEIQVIFQSDLGMKVKPMGHGLSSLHHAILQRKHSDNHSKPSMARPQPLQLLAHGHNPVTLMSQAKERGSLTIPTLQAKECTLEPPTVTF